jgi:hypothetical protein
VIKEVITKKESTEERENREIDETKTITIRRGKMNEETKALVRNEKNEEIVKYSIPDERISEILQTGKDNVTWFKFNPTGFVFNDKVIPEIQGTIYDLVAYLIKFEGNTPHKLANVLRDEEIPVGYERRCDLKIDLGDLRGAVSLPKTSLFSLKPYLLYLQSKGLRLEQVTTKLRTHARSNQHGTYAIVSFEYVCQIDPDAGSPPMQKPPPKSGTPNNESQNDQAIDNPWA